MVIRPTLLSTQGEPIEKLLPKSLGFWVLSQLRSNMNIIVMCGHPVVRSSQKLNLTYNSAGSLTHYSELYLQLWWFYEADTHSYFCFVVITFFHLKEYVLLEEIQDFSWVYYV